MSIEIWSGVEEFTNALECGFGISQFALPNHHRGPSPIGKFADAPLVARLVRQQLRRPIVLARFGGLTFRASVKMPEATVDEDYLTATRKNDVGTSRQILWMQAISIATLVQEPS
jgi:hypothetical protein